MVQPFSSIQRLVQLRDMAKQELDLLVIGGGITGAGIALDAQVRGIQTGLIDMQDYAEGTSSRSTKLVHGGLRYLKQFEVKLVAEVGKERAIVYENAPHVTTPVWMLLPIYKEGTFGTFSTSVGLKAYDFLAGVKKHERRSMLSKEKTLEKEPLLNKDGLLGGGYYVEYRTDDARLTLETIKEAVNKGTKAINYVKAEELLYDHNGKLNGVRAVDQMTRQSYDVFAKKIVNATGPWVDTLREKDHSKKGKYLHLTKGVHLVIDGNRFPLKNAVYFDTPNGDGRMVFAIPRAGKVYVGTTDTNYKDDLMTITMNEQDRTYILNAINGMFPNLNLTKTDVESSWAGVRPLIHEEGKDPSEISRKDEIFVSDSNLITIAGGKLTGYRKMAERTVDLVAEQLAKETGQHFPKCTTNKVRLSGGHVGGSEPFENYVQEQTHKGVNLDLSTDEAEKLVNLYGTNVERIYEIIQTSGEEAQNHKLPKGIYAQLVYSIEEEMTTKPVDFFIRRTSALFFDIEWVKKWLLPITDYMQKRLDWTDEEKQAYLADVEKTMKDAVEPQS